MKVIALNASPRENGNTKKLLELVCNELEEAGVDTEIISLSTKSIHSCRACFGCMNKCNCIVEDDFQELFEKLIHADGLILASPVYSANISSKMQAFLERAAVVLDTNSQIDTRYKVCASLATCRRCGSLHTLDAMNHFFLNHQMLIVGSTYWNMGMGMDVSQDQEALNTMKNLGKNMSFVLNKMK